MFSGCTGLTTAPELPATKLASYCYSDMFYYCTGLTTAPEKLPATTLADACYYEMFIHCSSLTTAPELPAKELKSGCYSDMFHGCTSLTYLKCLATSIASGATHSPTSNWVIGVPASGTFVKDASVRFGSGEFWNTSEEYGSTTSCAAKAIANWTVQDAQ